MELVCSNEYEVQIIQSITQKKATYYYNMTPIKNWNIKLTIIICDGKKNNSNNIETDEHRESHSVQVLKNTHIHEISNQKP